MMHTKKIQHTIRLQIGSGGQFSEELINVIREGLRNYRSDPYDDNSSKKVYVPDHADFRLEFGGWEVDNHFIVIEWEEE